MDEETTTVRSTPVISKGSATSALPRTEGILWGVFSVDQISLPSINILKPLPEEGNLTRLSFRRVISNPDEL